MARIRTIKPEFWQDEQVGTLSADVQLLFLGLISHADDDGRLRGNPLLIRAQVFPYRPDIDVEAGLRVLAAAGRIIRYAVDEQAYIWVCRFRDHQKIDKPKASTLPAPPEAAARHVAEASPTHPRQVADESPQEGKGGEGNGREGTRARQVASRGARDPIPDGGPEFYGWAQDERTNAAGLIPEPPPAGFNAWWRDAHGAVNGDVERLRAGYRHFLGDRWAKERGLPWAAWAKQWAKHVPPEQPRSEIRDYDGTEDLYPCEPPPEAA